jgi:DUF4097 and DUF4098 domain-containing protein YvlB
MIRILWLAQAFALAALAQTSSGPAREGGYWVDTITGSAAAGESVRVVTAGAVHIQGEQRGDIVYSLKRRVKARDEASARAQLDAIAVKAVREGARMVLEVTGPDPRAAADLHVRVPRKLREAAVESSGGAIEIADIDGAVRVATAAGAVEVNRVGGGVAVRTGGGAVRLDQIGGSVECFTGGGTITAGLLRGDATLATGGGEIVVREAHGLVKARTLGGNIRIERADRGVQAAAIRGLVDVIQAGGPVRIETGTGAIRVRASTNVHCESETGTIQLQATSGGLRAITRTGSILADLSGVQKIESSTLVTSAGDITVLIPSNLRVTVEAVNSTSAGQRIVSDFGGMHPQAGTGSVAEVALNGGGPLLRLTTAGGTIYLRRPK